MLRETSYDSEEMWQCVDQYEPLLTPDQYNVYKSVLRTTENRNGGLIFLNAPGGTGKTFLINLLLAKIRQTGKIALAVAASGIAATHLTGGRTAHSAFKLPLNLAHCETPTCNMKRAPMKPVFCKKLSLLSGMGTRWGGSSYILVYTDVPLEWVLFLTSQIYQWDAIFMNLLYQMGR
jgi:hypothetical protein